MGKKEVRRFEDWSSTSFIRFRMSLVKTSSLPFKEREEKSHSGPVPFVCYKTSLNGANRVVVPFFFRPKRDAARNERVERVRVDFGLSVVAYFAETHVHLNSYLKCT